jgi:hypothetical protein
MFHSENFSDLRQQHIPFPHSQTFHPCALRSRGGLVGRLRLGTVVSSMSRRAQSGRLFPSLGLRLIGTFQTLTSMFSPPHLFSSHFTHFILYIIHWLDGQSGLFDASPSPTASVFRRSASASLLGNLSPELGITAAARADCAPRKNTLKPRSADLDRSNEPNSDQTFLAGSLFRIIYSGPCLSKSKSGALSLSGLTIASS